MSKVSMKGFLKMVTIVVSAGSLISAIFTPDEEEELNKRIDKRLDERLNQSSEEN